MDLPPSDSRQHLGWLSGLGLVALGVLVSFVAYTLLSTATGPRFWLAARDTFGWPAQIASIAYLCWGALSEEISKSLGALSARLNTNRVSWWVTAACVGASFGLIERVLLLLNWTPEFLAQVTPLMLTVLNTSAVFSHAALCVLSAAIALSLGGTWRSWIVGTLSAGTLHTAHNLLPRFVELGWSFAWPAILASVMLTILAVTFALRNRIAQSGVRA